MEKIREKKKEIRNRIKKDVFGEDEKGRAVIKINITDSHSVLSDYNDDGDKIISSETAEFIDSLVKSVPKKKDIVLDIRSENYTKDKEEVYRKAIENYYVNKFADKDNKLKHNAFVTLIMLVLGVIGFTLLYILTRIDAHWLILDIVEVASWVFLWEMVDVFFLQNGYLKIAQKRYLKIIYSEKKFKKLSTEK